MSLPLVAMSKHASFSAIDTGLSYLFGWEEPKAADVVSASKQASGTMNVQHTTYPPSGI
jgi:hypothetical protein